MTKITYIPGEIANAAIDEHGNRKPVTRTHHIFDDEKGKTQDVINQEVDDAIGNDETSDSIKGRIKELENQVGEGGTVDERIAEAVAPKANSTDVYAKSETYNKTELNNMITTPNQQYVTVMATDQTTAATDVLPATGVADTVYRVGNWDGSQFDVSVYSEYAWNGADYVHLSTKTQIGEVFDISAYHATGGELAKYANLSAALGTNGENVPQSLQKGGMSVKFVQSPDHNYVQFRYMGTEITGTPNPFLDTANWQGVDDEPTFESNNLVESGGTKDFFDKNKQDALSSVFNAINNNKLYIKKDTYSLQRGKYYYYNGGVLTINRGHFSSVPIYIDGYKIQQIVLRGNVGITVSVNNVFLTDDSNTILYNSVMQNDGRTIDVSHVTGAKYLYFNFFNIDNSDYYFELDFKALAKADDIPQIDDKITIGGVGLLPNNIIYPELGVVLNIYGWIDTNGNYMSTGGHAWSCSDYIPVIKEETIRFRLWGQNTVNIIAFYDDNYKFISGLVPDSDSYIESTINVPSTAFFARFCTTNIEHHIDDCYVFLGKNTVRQRLNKLSESIHLFDSINKPINFNGKIILTFGDSITAGVSSPNLQPAGANSYIKLFCSHVGAILNNKALSGSCIVPGLNNIKSIYESITETTDSCDMVLIAGGVNDWQQQASIGVFGDDNTTTLYGVLKKICDYLTTQYSGKPVIFITPIPTTSTTTFGTMHPDNLNLYRKAIQETAMYYGFNVVNGADLGLPDSKTPFGNVMFASNDCIHPTLAGHALYARSLAGKLL